MLLARADFWEDYGGIIFLVVLIYITVVWIMGSKMIETARAKGYSENGGLTAGLVIGALLGMFIFVCIYIAALPDLKTQKMLETIVNDKNNSIIDEELPEI